MRMIKRRFLGAASGALLLGLSGLSGCGSQGNNESWPAPKGLDRGGSTGGISLFGGGSGGQNANTGIGVNSFLWRASLDTLAFMPLTSADPFGGVIITDWRSDPASPEERFKMTVYILDQQLRADGLRVAVFRQIRDSAGVWSDAAVNPDTGLKLENAILTRARQLRINTLEAQR